jgi:DNA-directed RNA polymerase specialized sigma24 family protein
MSHETNLEYMPVENLAQKCAQETDFYFNHKNYDSRYCFELFRRAIRSKDERALEVIIVQYRPLVAYWVDRWVSKHPEFSLFNEETQDFVAQAFERFWVSYTSAKFEHAQSSLPAVLKYLQMCVHGALTDSWRKLHRLQLEQDTREEERELSDPAPTPEALFQKDELWQLIRKKSKHPKEYLVLYASFYLNLSPRDILAEYPDQFGEINEVYRYKTNILERLERDNDFREFVGRP